MKQILAITAMIFFALNSSADTIVKPTVATRVHKPHPSLHTSVPRKPKLLRSNPLRLSAIQLLNMDPLDLPDDEDLVPMSIRRPKLVKNPFVDDDNDLSDEIAVRLAVARSKAMNKYRETWA